MRRRLRAGILVLLLALVALSACGASGAPSGGGQDTAARKGKAGEQRLALQRVGDFDSPVYVTGAPGFPHLLFVVEQPGKVVVLRHGHRLARPFLDISDLVSFEGERGLLSIAFPPNYRRSGRIYAYYVDNDGNIRIDEFHRRSPVRARRGSRREVIGIPHPVNANHNGGQLQFLGKLLYFATGDGGSGGDPPNNAQSKDVLLGKLLRIDPRPSGGRPYSIPSSNPFVGRPGRDEIYSYGLRNPFRFSFDSGHGAPRIAIGDVGQNRFEELDYLPVASADGANFGWDAFEGFAPYREENSGTKDPGGTTKPIFAYPHSRDGSCTIIGGYVVHAPNLPSLHGRYVYADFCEGQLRSLVPHLGRATGDRKLGLTVESPSSFGEDDRGRLYGASITGQDFRLLSR
jgi:glucose/arabinose dehydrogenase